jgi:hypothetical protein
MFKPLLRKNLSYSNHSSKIQFSSKILVFSVFLISYCSHYSQSYRSRNPIVLNRRFSHPKALYSMTSSVSAETAIDGSSASSASTTDLIFDKSLFSSTVRLVALKIPAKQCNIMMNSLQGYLFVRPRIKRIHDTPDDPNSRLLLLSETVTSLDLNEIPTEVRDKLSVACNPVVTGSISP